MGSTRAKRPFIKTGTWRKITTEEFLPDYAIEYMEERAAIMEFDGGLDRQDAEDDALTEAIKHFMGPTRPRKPRKPRKKREKRKKRKKEKRR